MNNSIKQIFILLLSVFFWGCEVGISPLEYDPSTTTVETTGAVDANGDVGQITVVLPENVDDAKVSIEIYGPGSEHFSVKLDKSAFGYIGDVTVNPNFIVYHDTTFKFFARTIVNGQKLCAKEIQKTVYRTEVAPVVKNQTHTMNEDSSIALVLEGSDRNDDRLSFNIKIPPKHGTLSANSVNLTYTPNLDYFGTDSFTYVANDGRSDSNIATVNLIIVDTPDEVPVEEILKDTIPPVISLNGVSAISIILGMTYVDAGATAVDNRDENIRVVVSGSVDTSTVGSYEIMYTATDAAGNVTTEIRVVTVLELKVLDTIPPVITLNGIEVNLFVGDVYVDAGATANDNIDGNITAKVQINNQVDTNIEGNYAVTYNVTDSAGNVALEVIRTVIVQDTKAPVITLLGNNPQTIEAGQAYTELNASIDDSSTIVIDSSNVNISVEGNYTVTYNARNSAGNTALEVIRTVIVQDTIAPVITLLGRPNINIPYKTDYIDARATANDDGYGDITNNIVMGGDVNTSKAGEYTITYDVNDTNGNSAVQVTRTVTVGAKPNINIGNITVIEGNIFDVNVSLDNQSGKDIDITLSFANGSATAGDDYNASTVSVQIPAGSLWISVNLDTFEDTVDEANETFEIVLTPSGGSVGTTNIGTVTIIDNDNPPTVSIELAQNDISEGETAYFILKLSNPSDSDIDMNVTTQDDSAQAGSDYVKYTGVVSIPAGMEEVNVSVNTIEDIFPEGIETFLLNAQVISGRTQNSDISKSVNVLDDDGSIPSFIIYNAQADESGTLTFDVNLTNVSAIDTTINISTISDTAGEDDYESKSLFPVVIPMGSLGISVDVGVKDDNISEKMETFTLQGKVTSGNTLNTENNATGTIIDNEPYPVLIVKNTSAVEGQAIVFDINLSVASSEETRIKVWTNKTFGTAKRGADYEPVGNGYSNPEYIIIPAATLSTSVSISTIDDDIYESNETFRFVAKMLDSTSLRKKVVGTILNDDDPLAETLYITSNAITNATEDVLYTYTPEINASNSNATFVWSLESNVSNIEIDSSTGKFTWTPVFGDTSASVHLTVKDTNNLEINATQDFNINVIQVNDAPIAYNVTINVKAVVPGQPFEAIPFELNVSDEETDNNALSYIYKTHTNGGIFTGVNFGVPMGSYKPADNASGKIVFEYAVVDSGDLPSDWGTITFIIEESQPDSHLLAWCDDTNGVELWRTNGTTDGTLEVLDKESNPVKNPKDFTKIGKWYYFSADDGNGKRTLWRSDGSNSGTFSIDTGDIRDPQELIEVNGILFFTAIKQSEDMRQVYKLNVGDILSLISVKTTTHENFVYRASSMLTRIGNLLFFVVQKDDNSTYKKIVRLDLSTNTALVGGTEYDNISDIVDVDGKLYYSGTIGAKSALIAGTDNNQNSTPLKIFTSDAAPQNLHNYNGTLVFEGHDATNGDELWKSDGTSDGTKLVENFAGDGFASAFNANPQQLTVVGNTLYFEARTAVSSYYVRKLDSFGVAITETLNYVNGDESFAKNPKNLRTFSNTLFFNTGVTDENSNEWVLIWSVDASGNAQIYKYLEDMSTLYTYEVLNDKLLFRTTSSLDGTEELKITNGNQVTDIVTGCSLQ